MNSKQSRIETIVNSIVFDGRQTSKKVAWQYLRSESARAEAEMVNVSHLAQQEVIASIGRMKPKDFASYNTQKTIETAKDILGTMLGDCEAIARRMITANVLAGKINALSQSESKGNELIALLRLTESDNSRVDKMVSDVVGKIQKGVSLTITSVTTMLQNAAVRANMRPNIINNTDSPKSNNKQVKDEQEPISNMFVGVSVDAQKPQKSYREQPLTNEELEAIKKNPIAFAKTQSKNNVDIVTKLHDDYLKGKTNGNPLDSQGLRDKALKEINGDPAAKAVFELNKALRMQGLFAFVDKGNKRWTLESYCAMSTRTISAQSTNLGDVFADNEHDLYYIVPHAGSCPLCAKYEGRVYSRSGKSKKYPPLAIAFSKIDPNGTDDLDNTYWTIHPNCRHKIVKYVEQSKTNAEKRAIMEKSNRPFELTKKQQEEIRENKERERLWNERAEAMREFQMYLQVLSPKEAGGNFVKFFEHKQKDDSMYKKIKERYQEIVSNAT